MTTIAAPNTGVSPSQRKVNVPKFSIVAAALLIALAITAIVIGSVTHTDITPIMGFIALAIPTLLSSGYAERNSNDLRNGVVQDKANQGTLAALHSTGLVEAATAIVESKGSTNLAMEALARLLELSTTASNTNTDASNANTIASNASTIASNANTAERQAHHSISPVQVLPVPDNSVIVTHANVTPPTSPVTPLQVESAGGKTNG